MQTKQLSKSQASLPPVHPGMILFEEIKYRGIYTEELAAWMKIELAELLAILEGEKPIDTAFALKIEETIGVDAYYWLKKQAKYNVYTSRVKESEKNPKLLVDKLSGSFDILSRPKSVYTNTLKKAESIFVSRNWRLELM